MDMKKIAEIVTKVVAYLGTLPLGTEISTWQATKERYGINGLEDCDLFEIDKQVRVAAKNVGMKLDSSKYNDCVVGLPFNIPFVIRKK